MKRQDEEEVPQDSGQRMDTMDDQDSYGDDHHGDKRDLGGIAEDDRLEVNMDDLEDDDSDDAVDLNKPSAMKKPES